jgi:hypothetical protein
MPPLSLPLFSSLRPFWLAAALALATAIVANLGMANPRIGNFAGDHGLYWLLAAAFCGAVGGHLWAQRRLRASAIAPVLGAAAGIAFMVLCGQNQTGKTGAVAGILLLAAIAPSCGTKAAPEELGRFWLQLVVAMAIGIAAALVSAAGMALFLFNLKYLFEIAIPGDLYNHVTVSAMLAIAPLFALSVLARRGDAAPAPDLRAGTAGRAILAILHYAVIPLTLAYAAMLHAYALKIAVSGQLPDGEIGWLVLAFGLAGTAAYLGILPWSDQRAWLLRVFSKGWFAMSVVPAILLAVAVAQRIADYGVTPPRYYLALYGLWLGGTAILMLVRRTRHDPRALVAGLGALLMLAGVGPWSVAAVSGRSQAAQLREVLARSCEEPGTAPLLETGWACVPPEGVARERATSALRALKGLDALDRLPPMFRQRDGDPFAGTPAELHARIRTALGADATSKPKDGAAPGSTNRTTPAE